ncbi:MAG: BMP family ABC transporter substrate-binding protein [Erysipelotrichaceae bacterium]|nr:BMP family ABC transporter substrate-binding protein [Erysipelotrichaceae bacterium]
MKKLIKGFLCCIICFSLFGCKDITKKIEGEVAYLVYYQSEYGENYHEAVSNALSSYMENHEQSYVEYQLTDTSTQTFVKTVELAMHKGSNVFIVPYSFFNALIEVHENYPDVQFVLLDSSIGDEYLENVDNILSISFNTYEMGYLAGSLIPFENYRKVGFLQSIHNQLEENYIQGIIDGLNDSAKMLEDQAGSTSEVKINFTIYDIADQKVDKRKETIAEGYQKNVDVFLYMDSSLFDLLDEYTDKSGYRFVGYCANDRESENVLFYSKLNYSMLLENLLDRMINDEELDHNLVFGMKDGAHTIEYLPNTIHKATERQLITLTSKINEGQLELSAKEVSNKPNHVNVVHQENR